MLRNARLLAGSLLAAAVLGLSACATGPQIRTDADPTVEFGQYRTWSYYKPVAMEQSGYSSWISGRIREDIQREMDARGYRYVEEAPDLLVNFQGVVQDRTDVFSMPRTDIRWFYNYRRNSYFAVPVWYDETQVSRYKEGTLTVDLVDARRNHMVWTGAAIGRVAGKQTPEARLAEVDRAIADIFAQYPHRAGSP